MRRASSRAADAARPLLAHLLRGSPNATWRGVASATPPVRGAQTQSGPAGAVETSRPSRASRRGLKTALFAAGGVLVTVGVTQRHALSDAPDAAAAVLALGRALWEELNDAAGDGARVF